MYMYNSTKCNLESNHHSKYPGLNTSMYVHVDPLYIYMHASCTVVSIGDGIAH